MTDIPRHNNTLGLNVEIRTWRRIGIDWLFAGEAGVNLGWRNLALPFRIALGILLGLRCRSNLRPVGSDCLLIKLYR